jgi:hypothetical protein
MADETENQALFGSMADEAGNQEDRYNTDVQRTEAERIRWATELAAHERGTARGLEPHGAAGGAVGGGGEEAHQKLCGTTCEGTKMPE